ncbi:hypothetical protein C8R43DRAFT_367587 [Mycena crocata]|nr:hypothetical protein C8R43DRAFT_367587 [Mycena crocata]
MVPQVGMVPMLVRLHLPLLPLPPLLSRLGETTTRTRVVGRGARVVTTTRMAVERAQPPLPPLSPLLQRPVMEVERAMVGARARPPLLPLSPPLSRVMVVEARVRPRPLLPRRPRPQTLVQGTGAGNTGGGANNGNGNTGGNTGGNNGGSANIGPDAQALQSALVLDPSVICTGFADDGQNPPVTGQTASSTSTNNYINFCAKTLPGTPLTNGAQITTGSCNPAPIGLIPSTANMPSAKFTFPKNFATIPALEPFTISMALQGMEAGHFTNAQKTYFAAPQFLNGKGQIVGHAHFVVEAINSLDQITPTDPKKFVFFKGIDDAGSNGILSTPVTAGVPAGNYRVCSINSAANHQPVIVPIAQHGSLDDCSYFTAVAGNSLGNATIGTNLTASALPSGSASLIGSALPSASAISASAVGASASAISASAVGASVSAISASAVVPSGSAVFSASALPSASAAPVKGNNGKGGKGGKGAVASSAAIPAVPVASAVPGKGDDKSGKGDKGAVASSASAPVPSKAAEPAAEPAKSKAEAAPFKVAEASSVVPSASAVPEKKGGKRRMFQRERN